MKTPILIITAAFLISINLSGQTGKDAPANIKAAFSQKFPTAAKVTWSAETAKEWEAEFTNNGKTMSASYDNQGKWLESETGITAKDLPAPVTNTLSKEFNGYKAGEMSILESQEMNGFEIALTKGETTIEVVIDKNGKVLKNTPVAAESEKN